MGLGLFTRWMAGLFLVLVRWFAIATERLRLTLSDETRLKELAVSCGRCHHSTMCLWTVDATWH
jgi:hypothetical protein